MPNFFLLGSGKFSSIHPHTLPMTNNTIVYPSVILHVERERRKTRKLSLRGHRGKKKSWGHMWKDRKLFQELEYRFSYNWQCILLYNNLNNFEPTKQNISFDRMLLFYTNLHVTRKIHQILKSAQFSFARLWAGNGVCRRDDGDEDVDTIHFKSRNRFFLTDSPAHLSLQRSHHLQSNLL